MIVRKHGLVSVTINDRLSLRGTRATWLQLCYELRFLVGTEVVSEKLGRLEFLTHNPKAGLGGVEEVLMFILFL